MNSTTTQPGRAQIQPRYLDVAGAEVYLGRSEDAIYTLVARRRIPYRKEGRKLIFDRVALDAWIAALEGVSMAEAVDRTLHGGEIVDTLKTRA